MIGTVATVVRQQLGGAPQAPLGKDPAAARSGRSARAGDPSDPLQAAWRLLAGATGGHQSDRRPALDMMCD